MGTLGDFIMFPGRLRNLFVEELLSCRVDQEFPSNFASHICELSNWAGGALVCAVGFGNRSGGVGPGVSLVRRERISDPVVSCVPRVLSVPSHPQCTCRVLDYCGPRVYFPVWRGELCVVGPGQSVVI